MNQIQNDLNDDEDIRPKSSSIHEPLIEKETENVINQIKENIR